MIVTGPHVFAMIGPPGAGKSTWCDEVFGSLTRISLDRFRAQFSACGGEENMAVTDKAVLAAFSDLRRHLTAGRHIVWDATNAKLEYRANLLRAAQIHQARTTAVVLLPALDVVLDRNSRRDATVCAQCGYARRVPEDVVRGMFEEIEKAIPWLPGEGWDNVIVA